MIHVALTMANNSSTPYFNRFAERIHQYPEYKFSFVCLYPEEPEMIEDMKRRNCDCYWIRFDENKKKNDYATSLIHLFRLFKKIHPDIVHTHLFDDSLPGLAAARLAGIKCRIISKLDSGYHYHYNPKWVSLDKLNNWNATHILSVSEENRKFIIDKEGVQSDKITLIHQGIPFDEVTNYAPSIKDKLINKYNIQGKKVILVVARYLELKGYRNIIEAAHILINYNNRKDLIFLCFGWGNWEKEFNPLVKNRKLEQYFSFNNSIDREELNCIYNIADMFIHASLYEPFGFVIAEAMVNGLPVVATRTGAAADVIEHKINGYLVKPNDSQGIAEGIRYVLDNNTDVMQKNAKETARSNFSIEAMLKKHLELYEKCVK
ncbi:MAG: glycosyltransferase family 4 protein [Bacteroidetes bacterium]|nr:glycosyltransferase family 4 protein [Bacteroidota bacterium]